MRPYATTRRADIALVELGGNGVVTGCTGPHDLFDDGPHIGRKPPRIRLGNGPAAFCNFADVRVAQNLPALLGSL
jgi:hypothetical protein